MFFWEVFVDVESGINFVEWCVGSSFYLCDIVLWIVVELSIILVEYFLFIFILFGMVVFIKLRVLNGVGM